MTKSVAKIITNLFMMGLVLQPTSGMGQEHEHSSNQHPLDEKKEAYYICSMHPQIRESEPGRCPICSMALTKVEWEDDHEEEAQAAHQEQVWQCKDFPDVTNTAEGPCPIDGSPMILKDIDPKPSDIIAKVKLRKAHMNHFYPEYFTATTMKMSKNIRLLGTVLQTEEKESVIPARVEGRVEKVMVASRGKLVTKGEPVLTIYSPKLISTGEEYIISRRSYNKNKKKDFKSLMIEAKERLELWGITSSQYESWYKAQRVPNNITIYSPETGIVSKRIATVGKYFKEGQNFFELHDLSEVWVEMDVYEHDSGIVDIGQEVTMKFAAIPGEEIKSTINFINPFLDPKSRTLKVRATITNSTGKLKPGMIADATVNIPLGDKEVVIPRTAIIDTGKRKVVWMKKKGRTFEARIVKTGFESEGYVAIKEGLDEGDSVVIEGNFLLDAQAQLFGGYTAPSDTAASSGGHGAHQH